MLGEDSPNFKAKQIQLPTFRSKEITVVGKSASQNSWSDDLGLDGDQDNAKDKDHLDENGSDAVYETNETLGMEGADHDIVFGEKCKRKKGPPVKIFMAGQSHQEKLNDCLCM
ncbi:unnamed protein product [Sphagnum jensenii]|jgi:hypothetical protein